MLMRTSRMIYILAVFLLLVVSIWIFRQPILSAIGDFLIVKDDLHPVDLIHVIAGPDYRTDYAIQLYKQGDARQIFFTGPWCSKHQVIHSEHGREKAIQQGVPSEAIAVDGAEINSTYSEALRLKEFIQNSSVPIHSILVVSDPYHMRRAQWTYRKIFGDQITILMAPVPFQLTPYTSQWWAQVDSREMVKDEYVKTVFYFFRYQLGWGPLRDWLATFDQY